ncbi:hypothetical protein OQA88_554 [Cercophora sp. LCS_1]
MAQLMDVALSRVNALLEGTSTTALALTAFLLPLAILFLKAAYFPSIDSREPPLQRSTIPFIGHIVGLIRESASYFTRLQHAHRFPICTLPMLNGKMYLICSPALISAAMKNRDLSFDPFALEFSSALLEIPPKYVEEWSKDGWYQSITDVIHSSLTGENLKALKAVCYKELATALNKFEKGTTHKIDNAYEWLSVEVPRAFMTALWGKNNPIGDEVVRAIWDFDQSVAILANDLWPRILAPKAFAARRKLQNALKPYYEKELWRDEDVSAIMKNRALKIVKEGGGAEILSLTEWNIAWASITNTVPDLYWLLVNIFSRMQCLERFRKDVGEMTVLSDDGKGGRVGVIDAGQLEKKPYVAAVYWETHRVYNENLGHRRVMKETVLKDADGREYLLKKGINIQIAVGAPHRDTSIWGPDAEEWRPERWTDGTTSMQEKIQRSSLFPFGGGRNLCPGQKFAISESLGMLAVLAMGFDIDGVQVPEVAPPLLANAMRKPVLESVDTSINLSRRKGYEDVTWSFKLDS